MVLARVRGYIREHRLLEKGDRVLLAVSGGADSMAMLELFHQLAPEFQAALHVVHLNHKFRGAEAAEDAEFVRREAEKRGIPSTILAFNVPAYRDKHCLSSQDAARRARHVLFYRVARRVGATKMAAAHHRDDQVETVLLNILRGTGPKGLRGMQPRRRWGKKEMIRPLLRLSRDEIENFLQEQGVPHRLDRSNLKDAYLRNKVRLRLLPLLEKEYNPRFRDSLLALSTLMGELEAYLAEETFRASVGVGLAHHGKGLTLDRLELRNKPDALQGRVLHHALKVLAPRFRDITYRHIRDLQALAAEGRTGSSLDLPGGLVARVSYRQLHLSRGGRKKAPQEPGVPLPLPVPGEAEMPREGKRITARVLSREEMPWPPDEKTESLLDYDKTASLGPLTVRFRRPGDRLQPLGLSGNKKLKDFLMDRKVPRAVREKIPLVTGGGKILWVAGFTIHEGFKITGKTERILHLKVEDVGGLTDKKEGEDLSWN